jgi:hypothetical protein
MTCWQFLGFVHRFRDISGFLGFSLVRAFFIAIFFSGGASAAGNVYCFDKKDFCNRIEAAQTWRDLVPLIQDQLRLHIYMAERMKFAGNEYEYFQRDWDEPLVAVGRPKELHVRLIEWINNLAANDLSSQNYCAWVALSYHASAHDVDAHEKEIKRKNFELFSKGALSAYEKPMRGQGKIKQDKFYVLYEAALLSERKKRRKNLEQFCRVWLMARGKLPVVSSINMTKSHKVPFPVVYKDELLGIANELRWKHEWSTKGQNSFVRYLASSQKDLTDEGRFSAFCRTTAAIINGHLDMYGIPSSLTIENNQEQFFITSIKDIMKDSVQRFHRLLSLSISQVSQGSLTTQEKPFLISLNEKQFSLRKNLAISMQTVLAEEEAPVTPLSGRRGRAQVIKSHAPRSADWHPPTDAEKAEEAAKVSMEKWERLQLIDEVKLVLALKDGSKTVWPYSSAVVDSNVLARRAKAGLLPLLKGF